MPVARQRNPLPLDPAWAAFARRQAGHPFLQEDPLYALDLKVIAAINSEVAQRAEPTFCTEEELAFEYDLAGASGRGFFLGRPIHCDRAWLGETEAVQAPTTSRGTRSPILTVEELLVRLSSCPPQRQQQALDHLGRFLTEHGGQVTEGEAARAIEDFLGTLENASAQRGRRRRRRELQQEEDLLQRREEAYGGWLVLNPTYRAEVSVLRQHCEGWVVDERRFPCLGEYGAYLGTRPGGESGGVQASPGGTEGRDPRPAPPGEPRQGHPGRFLDFYQRWGLDRLLTWDLPLPMGIVRCEVSELAGTAPPFDGVALLIPWPLLRGEQVDFQASLARLRARRGPAHLAEWLTSARRQ
jgi:hypothetical protein